MTIDIERARREFVEQSPLFRAGVKIRFFDRLREVPEPSSDYMDSLFISAVAAELRGELLP